MSGCPFPADASEFVEKALDKIKDAWEKTDDKVGQDAGKARVPPVRVRAPPGHSRRGESSHPRRGCSLFPSIELRTS